MADRDQRTPRLEALREFVERGATGSAVIFGLAGALILVIGIVLWISTGTASELLLGMGVLALAASGTWLFTARSLRA